MPKKELESRIKPDPHSLIACTLRRAHLAGLSPGSGPTLSPTLSLWSASTSIMPAKRLTYVYGVLYSESYRRRCGQFLKSDFPRVPFAKDRYLFQQLAALGKKLVDLHLLRSSELDRPICRFQGKGDNRVEKRAYVQNEKRV